MQNKYIFQKKNFTLCEVPVPLGYPQSQTHSGISLINGSYVLTTSPYPSVRYGIWAARIRHALHLLTGKRFFKSIRGEYYENPLMYIGVDDGNPPTKFRLMQDRPLMECPDAYYGLPAFNSDPDLFIDGNTVNVLNRAVYRTKLCYGETLNKYYIRLFLIQGIVDGERFKYYKTELLKENNKLFASPCLFKYQDRYILTYLDTVSYIDGKTYRGLYYTYGSSIEEIKENEEWKKIKVQISGYLPWHMSVFEYKNKLYSIVACVKENEPHRCWQMFGEFTEDLSALKLYNTPLTDYDSYRGSACVNDSGDFVLYNTTVHEKIEGGKSVDGREVIMAHMPFNELLKKLRDNE